jgi:hypothetical protein
MSRLSRAGRDGAAEEAIMYLMYVDESGDDGLVNSPTRYYVLTGLVVHELRWRAYLEEIIALRRQFRQQFQVRLRDEFHAGKMLTRPGEWARIPKHDRLTMIRLFADHLARLPDINFINIVVDKPGKPPGFGVFDIAWKTLIQRLENTVSHHNFPGPQNADERGAIFCDHTQDKKLTNLLRQMRRFNPIPNQPVFGAGARNLPLQFIIEDPVYRDSAHSYFVQAVDLAAFLLYQHLAPSAYMRKKGGKNYFARLGPVLCRVASRTDPDGIVRL